MNYNIKGTELEITPELRDYVEKKLAHADTFTQDDSTAHVDIELEFKPLGRSKKYRAEFTLAAKGSVYRVNEWGETMHEAIDVGAAELASELRQTKKKSLHTLRSSAAKVKEFLRGWRKKI